MPQIKTDDNFNKINKLKQIYDNLIKNSYTQKDAANELMQHSAGGYQMGQFNYPIIFFAGEYCLILDVGIYKKL